MMKRLMMCFAIAAALGLSVGGTQALAGSPVFGNAKVAKLDTGQMQSVVGKNATSAYYAYLGNFYASTAIQLASYGLYLEYFGSTYTSTRDYYYWNAYLNAGRAESNYYNAYWSN